MRIPIVTMLFTALLSVSSVAGKNRGDGMIPFLAITGKPVEAEVRAKVAAWLECWNTCQPPPEIW